MNYQLQLTLLSDATFGGGDSLAGFIDAEVEYEAETGLPYVRGRTIKGLLVEECANLLFALNMQSGTRIASLESAARTLFGSPGSGLGDDGILLVGNATLPEALRQAVIAEVKATQPRLRPADVLASLTDLRRQTAIDERTGSPENNSLRTLRVVIRQSIFYAPLTLTRPLDQNRQEDRDILLLLAACVASLRRGGTGRNRGRGRLKATLLDDTGSTLSLPLVNLFELQHAPEEATR